MEYLYHENREGAVIEMACRFLDARVWSYARPVEVKLEMARDVPRLEVLAHRCENLARQREGYQQVAHASASAYEAMSNGGTFEGKDHQAFEAVTDDLFAKPVIDDNVLSPIRQWLFNDTNLKKAKKASYAPLIIEFEKIIDNCWVLPDMRLRGM